MTVHASQSEASADSALHQDKPTTLHIEDVDIVDGTPLLDLKPYVPEFDVREVERIGWLAGKADKVTETEADERFR